MPMPHRLSALLLLSLSPWVHAADVAHITLDNGAKVRLKDDFTWEYVLTDAQASVSSPVTEAASTPPLPRLSASAMANSALIRATAKDGIKVNVANSQWNQDQLGLQFELASTSGEHVTSVVLEARFFADNGSLLKTEKLKIWQAIARMPETYLRKGEQRQSRTLWVDGIDKAQWQQQLIAISITEIESR